MKYLLLHKNTNKQVEPRKQQHPNIQNFKQLQPKHNPNNTLNPINKIKTAASPNTPTAKQVTQNKQQPK